MKNKKNLTILTIIIIFLLIFGVIIGSKNKKESSLILNKNQSEKNVPIFFYGNTCPHCKNVEEWMKKNNIESKIKIIKKEVYNNQKNSQELVKTAEKCGIVTDSIGVPFLYTDEGKCLIGTPDIINYLKNKAGLSEKEVKE